MNITENMFNIMNTKNIKSVDLARKLGVRSSVISSWKTRKTNPPSEYLLSICELLDVSVYELLGGENDTRPDEEQILLNSYRGCSPEDRQIIRDIACRLSSSPKQGSK